MTPPALRATSPTSLGRDEVLMPSPFIRGKVARSAGRGLLVAADDGDAGHVLARRAAEVVGHADARVFELAGAGAALELQVHLVEHAQARGADRMAEALQAAVDLAGDLAVGVVEAVEHVLPALAGLGDVPVFHGQQLG